MTTAPWLLVVVDGESEAKQGLAWTNRRGAKRQGLSGPVGAVCKIIEYCFGREAGQHLTLMYWHHVERSPLRPKPSARWGAWAEKARTAANLGGRTKYGAILLVDNDHNAEQKRDEQLKLGVEHSRQVQRTAYGVAREMLEAWLLADPRLPHPDTPLPKRPEDLWGDKGQPQSNYPKHVLKRCTLEPRGWEYPNAVEEWAPERARPHSPSLDAFMAQVEHLARSQGVA